MKTPTKKIKEYTGTKWTFNTLKQAQKTIREHNRTPDYITIDNILYTMEEYDGKGFELNYHNERTGYKIYVYTNYGRYDGGGFSKAVLELEKEMGFARNDITFAD